MKPVSRSVEKPEAWQALTKRSEKVATWSIVSHHQEAQSPLANQENVCVGYDVYETRNPSNSYWAIPMEAADVNKSGFLIPNGQCVYLRMGRRLKGAPHTYAQFGLLVFAACLRIPKVRRECLPLLDALRTMLFIYSCMTIPPLLQIFR